MPKIRDLQDVPGEAVLKLLMMWVFRRLGECGGKAAGKWFLLIP